MKRTLYLALLALLCGWSLVSNAAPVPDCLDGGRLLPIDNETVVTWKDTVPNGRKRQGHVQGPIVRIFPDKTGHKHFEIKIGPAPDDVIEVIYNVEFGPLPRLQVNMNVEACGEYITSNRPNNGYQASPSGAIIHWVHRSDNVQRHDSGFVVVDGIVCGQGHGKPRPHFDQDLLGLDPAFAF